ncbi:unnamed protein product [Cylindrotheca closterium]|uniref:Uncharacterized protein n=1 Tax=Cylindrotheca closterium TaxID=2856 RepID=A0AAD2G9U0_9STRA|nr:unnamed protein product [Cylindrotheca closterium]
MTTSTTKRTHDDSSDSAVVSPDHTAFIDEGKNTVHKRLRATNDLVDSEYARMESSSPIPMKNQEQDENVGSMERSERLVSQDVHQHLLSSPLPKNDAPARSESSLIEARKADTKMMMIWKDENAVPCPMEKPTRVPSQDLCQFAPPEPSHKQGIKTLEELLLGTNKFFSQANSWPQRLLDLETRLVQQQEDFVGRLQEKDKLIQGLNHKVAQEKEDFEALLEKKATRIRELNDKIAQAKQRKQNLLEPTNARHVALGNARNDLAHTKNKQDQMISILQHNVQVAEDRLKTQTELVGKLQTELKEILRAKNELAELVHYQKELAEERLDLERQESRAKEDTLDKAENALQVELAEVRKESRAKDDAHNKAKNTLQTELVELRKQLNRSEAENQELQDRLDEKEQECQAAASLEKEVEDLTKTRRQQEQMIAILHHNVQLAEERLGTEREQHLATTKQITELKKQSADELQYRLHEKEQSAVESEQLSKLGQENEGLLRYCTDLTRSVTSLKEVMESLEDENHDLRKELIDSKQSVSSLKEVMDTLEDENHDMREDLQDAKQSVKSLKEVMATLEDENHDLQKELHNAKQDVDGLQQYVLANDGLLADVTKEKEELQAKLEASNTGENLRQQLLTSGKQVECLMRFIREKDYLIEKVKSQFETELHQLQCENTNLKNKGAKLYNSLMTVQSSDEERTKRPHQLGGSTLLSLQATDQGLRERITEAERQIKLVLQEREAMQREIQLLQARDTLQRKIDYELWLKVYSRQGGEETPTSAQQ